MERGNSPPRRPIWEIDVLQRPTFVSAALGGDGAVRTFARNERGRDFVVGDIHGMFSALEGFLHELSFDAGRDRLFSVGDLIDRGAESEAVLQWLTGREWFHAIRGNHDQFLLDAAADPAGEWGEEYDLWVELQRRDVVEHGPGVGSGSLRAGLLHPALGRGGGLRDGDLSASSTRTFRRTAAGRSFSPPCATAAAWTATTPYGPAAAWSGTSIAGQLKRRPPWKGAWRASSAATPAGSGP